MEALTNYTAFCDGIPTEVGEYLRIRGLANFAELPWHSVEAHPFFAQIIPAIAQSPIAEHQWIFPSLPSRTVVTFQAFAEAFRLTPQGRENGPSIPVAQMVELFPRFSSNEYAILCRPEPEKTALQFLVAILNLQKRTYGISRPFYSAIDLAAREPVNFASFFFHRIHKECVAIVKQGNKGTTPRSRLPHILSFLFPTILAAQPPPRGPVLRHEESVQLLEDEEEEDEEELNQLFRRKRIKISSSESEAQKDNDDNKDEEKNEEETFHDTATSMHNESSAEQQEQQEQTETQSISTEKESEQQENEQQSNQDALDKLLKAVESTEAHNAETEQTNKVTTTDSALPKTPPVNPISQPEPPRSPIKPSHPTETSEASTSSPNYSPPNSQQLLTETLSQPRPPLPFHPIPIFSELENMGHLLINLSQQLPQHLKQAIDSAREEFQRKLEIMEADITSLQEELQAARAENHALHEQIKQLQATLQAQEEHSSQRDKALAEKDELLTAADTEIIKLNQTIKDTEDTRIAIGNLLEETRLQLQDTVQKYQEQQKEGKQAEEQLQRTKESLDEVNSILKHQLLREAKHQKDLANVRRERDAYHKTIQFQNQHFERLDNQVQNQKDRIIEMQKQVTDMKTAKDTALSNDFYLQEAFLQTQAEILLTEAIALSSVRVDAQILELDTLKQLLETLKKKIARTFRLARNMYLEGIVDEQ